MAQTEKALRILGFAHRARKLTFGLQATLTAVKSGKTEVVLLATDLSKSTRSKVRQLTDVTEIPVLEVGTKEMFGDYFKRKDVGIIGVTDSSFANGIRDCLLGSEIELQKREIRKEIAAKRGALKWPWVEATSSEIIRRLQNLPEFKKAQAFHCYVSWRNEVNTRELIKALLSQGRTVVVPVVDLQHRKLIHSQISRFEDLEAGAFGILEPPAERRRPFAISDLEVIVVPGVAFDRAGNRLGFGGGYYDDFLSQSTALKIGLCYQFQILENIPIENRDQKMDLVVSEKRIYRVGH